MGAPIAAARAFVERVAPSASAVVSAVGDPRGAIVFARLAEGSYGMRIEADGHESVAIPELQLPATEPIEVVLQRTASLRGQVLDPDGLPAADAEVTLAGSGVWPPRSVRTDVDGRFSLEPLPSGVYELRARRDALTSDPEEGLTLEAASELEVVLRLYEGWPLQGRVLDAASGTPLPAVRVALAEEALSASWQVVESDADGRFEIPGLRGVPHRAILTRDGHVSLHTEVTPGDSLQEFTLRQAGSLAGVVLDPDGEPVAGAELEVLGTTDVGSPLHLGPGADRFRLDLFQTRRSEAVGEPGAPLRDNLGVTYGPVPRIPLLPDSAPPLASPIVPAGSAVVAGAVAGEAEAAVDDRAFGADPGVDALLLSLRSGPDGRFHIAGLPPGQVQVVARHPGFTSARGPVQTLVAGAHLEGLRLSLGRGGRIEGEVRDGRGAVAAGVRLQLTTPDEPRPRMAVSGAAGEFAFDALVGEVSLTAFALGLPPLRQSVTVVAGETREVELVLPGQSLSLHGRAVNARGLPIASALVHVRALDPAHPLTRTTVTAVDGRFLAGGLPAPPYELHVEHSEYANLVRELVELPSSELELTLLPGVRLRGSVRDEHQRAPLGAARITLQAQGSAGAARLTHSGISGEFGFANLTPGDYTLTVEADGYATEARPLHIASDSMAELEPVALRPAGALEGEVVDSLGAPVFNAEVTAGEPADWAAAARTDYAGRFELRGLAPGDTWLSARHPEGGEVQLETEVRVLERGRGLLLRLPERVTPEAAPAPGPRERIGVAVALEGKMSGVVVRAVLGPAARAAGLRAGDRLVSIDGEPILAASQARSMLRGEPGSRVSLGLQRGAGKRTVKVAREAYVPTED
ncbi:MAG: carboxypeptidase regulatory-like domain-containing protein [Myxococcales bacterium]|nr:carboxypeptidase regulatory-like domain-containing protein [Myxococcales bacterium]